jgi:hypothetical protein
MILLSLTIATIISMSVMVLILMDYGNKQEEIFKPMQIKTSRLLSNGEISEVIPPEKKLQIISQNEWHVSIIMPDELGNIFRIEGPYDLNYNETRIFGYINKFTIWRAGETPKLTKFTKRKKSFS